MGYPPSIQNLIDLLSCLPSVGPRTAERYVLYLLNKNNHEINQLANALVNLKKDISLCSCCNSLIQNQASQNLLCRICADEKRQKNFLCVTADTKGMLSIEATREYNGLYFCLGNVINVIEGIDPSSLPTSQLIKLIKKNNTQEIILALDPNIEGETTIMYLIKKLTPLKIKITRLARGLSAGSSLEYADSMTLSNAFKYRHGN